MLNKTDKSALIFAFAAVGFFAIGGLLTTVVPPMVDSSWSRPFKNADELVSKNILSKDVFEKIKPLVMVAP